jgi:hypothetical protein
VRNVEITDRQVSTAVQSWPRRAEARPQVRVECCSELRGWVQRVILEAEENEGFDKKDRVSSLLGFFEIDHDFHERSSRENE